MVMSLLAWVMVEESKRPSWTIKKMSEEGLGYS